MSSKPPRQFRHPRSNRQRGFYSHQVEVLPVLDDKTFCAKCSFKIPLGEKKYRDKEGRYVCAVCKMNHD